MKFYIKSVYKLTVMSGLIMIALFAFTSQAFAQKPNYKYTDVFGYAVGGTGDAMNYGTTIDPSGNVYVTGGFNGIIDFNPGVGTDNKTAVGGNDDIFLTKINADESYAYTYTFGDSSSDFGTSVTTDSSGNVYITGSFQGTVNFDPTGGTDNHTDAGSGDGFLTKINANGTYGWTRTFGGPLGDSGNGVTIDSNGNVYVTGQFQTTTDFDPDGAHDVKSPVGTTGVFLMKINADGSYGYTDTFGGVGNNFGNGVTTDSSGNVYLTGFFSGTADFDPSGGTDNHTSAGGPDIFLTKINADGSYGYTDTFGGTAEDQGNAVKTDSTGNIYLTGYFSGTAAFPIGGTDPKTSAGGFDIFLTKINADSTYGYTYTFGSTDSDFGDAITTDSSGNVYLAGHFVGTVDFDPTVGVDNQTASGWDDAYLTKINADGTYNYTYIFGGSDPDNDDTFGDGGVAVDSNGIYIAGRFYNSADFDPTAGVDIRTTAGPYIYAWLTKLVFPSTPPPPSSGGGSGLVLSPIIHVTKMPSPSSLLLGPGSVTYTYTATNVGPVSMIGVWVKDDKCDPVNFISGDSNSNSMLDINEVWTYSCTKTVFQTETNTATAHGQSSGLDVYDTADATVVVSLPPPPIIIPPPIITPPVVPPIIGQVLGASTSNVPSFPKTGYPPQENNLSNISLPSSFLILVLASLVVTRRKHIVSLNKD